MWPEWLTVFLTVIKEIILIALLMLVLTIMIGGVFVIAIYNVPQGLWNFEGIYPYIGVFIVSFAPVFVLARVIEWWIAAYRRFSIIFPGE